MANPVPYNPETPFQRCDTLESVAALKSRLHGLGIDVVNVEGLNTTGRDCVILAMMYGVRPNQSGRRVVRDRDDNGRQLDLAAVTVDEMRNMLAEHIVRVWDDRRAWAQEALHMFVDHEFRSYLGQPAEATLNTVRDAYCEAIRGENGRERLFGDQGVQLAFASRFQCTVMNSIPARSNANRRPQMYRPLMFGARGATERTGDIGARTTCLTVFYVLGEGCGHAEPLRANRAVDGQPSRFTGMFCKQR